MADTYVTEVTFGNDVITTTVTSSGQAVDRWIAEILSVHRPGGVGYNITVGLDVEWRPSYRSYQNPVATLQLCVGRSCLIFQLLHADYVPGALAEFLGDRGICFFGVGVAADAERLSDDHGLQVANAVDLRGLSKMSKSAPSDQSRINLLDPKDVIANKIKRCKTDSFPGMEFDNPERPECRNLLSIYQIITGKTKEEVVSECQHMNWGAFKTNLTEALIDHLQPIQVRYEEIMSDPAYLDNVLLEGAGKAAEIADITLNNVYQAMGFLRR